MSKVVVISGATGQHGGATARALAGKGFTIRALTRNPDSDAAKALASQGAEIVKADLEVRKNSEDFALMLEWFERVGDAAGNAKASGVKPTTLREWAATVKR